MTKNTPHLDALRAYLKLLEKNIPKRAEISIKEHFARLLISKFNDKPVNHASYRIAVDSLIESLPANYKANAVLVAREFFPFLISDVKSVAAMIKTGSYRGLTGSNTVINDSNIKGIDDLIRTSEGAVLSDRESALHRKYLDCLRSLGAEDNVLIMRGKISKVLLYLARNKTVTGNHYRSVIDSVLPMLKLEETRFYFLSVSREFFYFLTEDPNAPDMVKVSNKIQLS